MTTLTTTNYLNERLAKLQEMQTPELLQFVTDKFTVTVESIADIACAVRILEDRKVDLGQLKIGILPLLRKVAYGQLMPGLVSQYAGRPMLLQYAQNLAMPDQLKLLYGERIKVVVLTDGSEPDAILVEPHKMTSQQVRQVFDRDHIRDVGEQRSYLEDRRKPKPNLKSQDVIVDAKRTGATINGKWFSRADLAALLARLA